MTRKRFPHYLPFVSNSQRISQKASNEDLSVVDSIYKPLNKQLSFIQSYMYVTDVRATHTQTQNCIYPSIVLLSGFLSPSVSLSLLNCKWKNPKWIWENISHETITNFYVTKTNDSRGCFIIKWTSFQYWKSHCGDKTILRPSYLHNWNSYTGKMSFYIESGHRDFVGHQAHNCAKTRTVMDVHIADLYINMSKSNDLYLLH